MRTYSKKLIIVLIEYMEGRCPDSILKDGLKSDMVSGLPERLMHTSSGI